MHLLIIVLFQYYYLILANKTYDVICCSYIFFLQIEHLILETDV